jgi:medium-chain acyl-[acyl-carrier-protein] hydrolase
MSSRWIFRRSPSANPSLRLFCLPYAGGTAKVYNALSDVLGQKIEVCAVEYPGHGTRFGDPLLRSVPSLVEQLGPNILSLLDRPFAIFGYSMGAQVGFELTRWLRARGARRPSLLVAGAMRAPQVLDQKPPTFDAPEAVLVSQLRSLGGVPPEILDHPDLLKLVLPIARADLQVTQTYRYNAEGPLDMPIEAFAGTHDPLASQEEVAAWRVQTTGRFQMHTFEGGHFFLLSAQSQLFAALQGAVHRTLRDLRCQC